MINIPNANFNFLEIIDKTNDLIENIRFLLDYSSGDKKRVRSLWRSYHKLIEIKKDIEFSNEQFLNQKLK